jgi:hypothetical protein
MQQTPVPEPPVATRFRRVILAYLALQLLFLVVALLLSHFHVSGAKDLLIWVLDISFWVWLGETLILFPATWRGASKGYKILAILLNIATVIIFIIIVVTQGQV